MKVWIVGKYKGEFKQWEFQGVFDAEERAVAECKSHRYFYAPANMNEHIPESTKDWAGLVYPLRPKQ